MMIDETQKQREKKLQTETPISWDYSPLTSARERCVDQYYISRKVCRFRSALDCYFAFQIHHASCSASRNAPINSLSCSTKHSDGFCCLGSTSLWNNSIISDNLQPHSHQFASIMYHMHLAPTDHLKNVHKICNRLLLHINHCLLHKNCNHLILLSCCPRLLLLIRNCIHPPNQKTSWLWPSPLPPTNFEATLLHAVSFPIPMAPVEPL